MALFQYSCNNEHAFFYESIRVMKQLESLCAEDDLTRFSVNRRIYLVTKLAYAYLKID